MEVFKSNMMGDESKNMDYFVGERYRELSEIKVMNDHYCIYNLISYIKNFALVQKCFVKFLKTNITFFKFNSMLALKNENQRQFFLIYCVFHIYALLNASLAIHKRKVCSKFKKRKSKKI